MKSVTKIVSVGAILALAVLAKAQQAPAPQGSEAGLLGKRYVSSSFSYVDIRHSSWDGYNANVAFNMPVTTNVDLTAEYDYSWLEGHRKINGQLPSLTATGYLTEGAFKPFASVGLGYLWQRNPGLPRTNNFVYDTEVGVEWAACSKAAVVASVGYAADFKAGDNSTYDGKIAVNYAVTKSIVATGAVELMDGGDVGFTLGAAYRF